MSLVCDFLSSYLSKPKKYFDSSCIHIKWLILFKVTKQIHLFRNYSNLYSKYKIIKSSDITVTLFYNHKSIYFIIVNIFYKVGGFVGVDGLFLSKLIKRWPTKYLSFLILSYSLLNWRIWKRNKITKENKNNDIG